jgi:Rieske 2Fe-2S family protein
VSEPGPKTPPARYFTDADLFRREMERFYFNRWVCVGRAETIPRAGDYFLADVAGESVIVTRDEAGALRAFFNVCRHRGTRLREEARGNFGSRIVCPYHAWSYGLDGCLWNAPQMDGAGFSREQYPLHAVRVAEWEGHIFLHCGPNPPPLEQQLGDLPRKFAPWGMRDLRRFKRIEYDVNANWKLAILNYNECLHCPMVHPALNRLTDYLGAENEAPGRDYLGGSMGFRGDAQTMTFDGRRHRAYLPGLNERERRIVCYYALVPNLLLSLHPDYMMVHLLWPRAVDRTRIVCEFYFQPDELAKPDFIGHDAVEFWDQTNREDWRVVELSQAGIGSRAYTPGPYSQHEELLRAFDEIVREDARPGEPRTPGVDSVHRGE